ncbi:hypothetical protein TIFTF001_021790 [Ficus carica]|uniref:Uncharacterized protein n=1 Tax=Ficus carica TaxID=3494 RepID=A0AA88AHF5_FICCA|nr:hypothetical protein TIFTF001_021790 [Ficus carica]
MFLVAADCCQLLLFVGIASRSATAFSVGGCSILWWRLRWAATMADGGNDDLGKLWSRFSFVIDVWVLFFDLQQNEGCNGDLVVTMLPLLCGRQRRWATSNNDRGLGLGLG